MMRTDSKGRSASPHRITYKSDFHAIKCSFDTGASLQPGTKAAAAHISPGHFDILPPSLSNSIMSHTSTSSSTGSRGRVHGTRGTRIKDNIFLQMDSQQLRQDGGLSPSLSSGSTPALSPQNPSLQHQTSSVSGSRRSVLSLSSVMSTVASISTPESSLLDKPSRSEEIRDIDRAALAQKFSVTRRLFETKMMEAEGGGGQVSKTVTGRGTKGITYGNVEGENGKGGGSQVEQEEEEEDDDDSGKRKHAAVDGFYKDKPINAPVINISSLKMQPQASLTRYSNYSGPSEASFKAACPLTLTEAERAVLDPCLTPEEPVRAELVSIKNESSESDENYEEKEQKEDKEENDMNSVEDLVDDVFDEPNMATTPECYILENQVEVRTGEVGPVASSEELWELPTSMSTDESGREKYQQVNEQSESKRDEKSDEMTDAGWEKSASWKGVTQQDGADEEVERKINDGGEKRCRQSQEKERTEKEKEGEREEVTIPDFASEVKHVACGGSGDGAAHKEDKTDSAAICGIENKAFVYDQESQAHPEHSPRQDLEISLHIGSPLLLEYEEIPGVPEQDDEDASDPPKRKINFSSAPIKVRKPFIC